LAVFEYSSTARSRIEGEGEWEKVGEDGLGRAGKAGRWGVGGDNREGNVSSEVEIELA